MESKHMITMKYMKDFFHEKRIFFTATTEECRFNENSLLYMEDDVQIEPYSAIYKGNKLVSMGSFSYSWSALPHNIIIKRYCSIAKGFLIFGKQHPYKRISSSPFTYNKNHNLFKFHREDEKVKFLYEDYNPIVKKIILYDDVWIGQNVTIKPGISIGRGAIVAANSVVTKDIPAFHIVGGNPAYIIKKRFEQRIINMIEETEWWKYKFTDFNGIQFSNPEEFCEQFLERKKSLLEYHPTRLTANNIQEVITK